MKDNKSVVVDRFSFMFGKQVSVELMNGEKFSAKLVDVLPSGRCYNYQFRFPDGHTELLLTDCVIRISDKP